MDVLSLVREVEAGYRAYLRSTFSFKDQQLRASFDDRLQHAGFLSRGPYVEAVPNYVLGGTTAEVMTDLLGRAPESALLSALQGNRRLYAHQEEALRRVASGRNVVVATGTGSGKTEAFLYPIIQHLYREFLDHRLGPGVRALILYPMNALANDQRDRLAGVGSDFSDAGILARLRAAQARFSFTFGQYTGETPENEHDSRRHARDLIKNARPGELVTRHEMRETPPHILLTNYSMLEYLLLRPDDSPLFDAGRGSSWAFLVLDEAHQYRGSKGLEMAMLLRRLKQRLAEGGRSNRLTCLATSATLVGGAEERLQAAQFASDLFGEPFWEEDVILAEHEPIPPASHPLLLGVEDYGTMGACLDGSPSGLRVLQDMSVRLGLSKDVQARQSAERTAGCILVRDERARALLASVGSGPAHLDELSARLFPDMSLPEAAKYVAGLIELLLRAQDEFGRPLLTARIHVLLRSLEGAFVRYLPSPTVELERTPGGPEGAAFEVAICRECGQHYFIGEVREGRLVEAVRDPSHPTSVLSFFRPMEEEASDDPGNGDGSVLRLCLVCGSIAEGEPACEHRRSIIVIAEARPSSGDEGEGISKCGACEYTGGTRNPVTEVVHGSDGPHSVVATTLFRESPQNRRKVLAFADGRQEAAFFAWYLQSSYESLLYRSVVLRSIRELASAGFEATTLRDVAGRLLEELEAIRYFAASEGDLTRRKLAWTITYRELLTDEARISLEGTGLVRWRYELPPWFEAPSCFAGSPWELSGEETRTLASMLLATLRADRASELIAEPGVTPRWEDLALNGYQTAVAIGEGLPKNVVRWDQSTGRRIHLLRRILQENRQDAASDVIEAGLRALWEQFRACDRAAHGERDMILTRVRGHARLNPEWWRVSLIGPDEQVFVCTSCGRLFSEASPRAVCPRYRCRGKLVPATRESLDENHYRTVYEKGLPGVLKVEEHTAQLSHEKARQFQREFREGRIHVLSCSTTFELGVDLGNLDTVFLRNVPPEPFNYTQRVGRAGRRPGALGLALTYSRRTPHDLYHFAKPERLIRGETRSPALSLKNEKIISRHIAALALSEFFRANPDRFRSSVKGMGGLESFFVDLSKPRALSDFRSFLTENQAPLAAKLTDVVPAEMLARVGVEDGRWIDSIAGSQSRLAQAEDEVSFDHSNALRVEADASAARDHRKADWAKRRATTIASEPVLSFLSRKAVIPKYGFPVDVVDLDTQRAAGRFIDSDVSLQRDLRVAISEYAPSRGVIANKKLWTSYSLKRVPDREWPRRRYAVCRTHGAFVEAQEGESELTLPCGCSAERVAEYLTPTFGFQTSVKDPREPTRRPGRVFTTRPYFIGLVGGGMESMDMPARGPNLVRVTKASPGEMVVVCEGHKGRGFFVCRQCGAGFRDRPHEPRHDDPYGRPCSGTLTRASLGHKFITDVLRLDFPVRSATPTDDEAGRLSFAYSLAFAVLEGTAEAIEVPASDLNVVLSFTRRKEAGTNIVLFDDVPGGAGLVARLEDEAILRRALEAARGRLDGACGCDEETSCYGCLRSYRNQYAHTLLKRGPAKEFLDSLLSQWS